MKPIDETIERGQQELDGNQYATAKDTFKSVLAENGEKWMAWKGLGFAHLELGELSEATEAFKKATVIRIDSPDAQFGLGLAYQRQNDHAKAIKAFEEALRHDHKHDGAKKAIGTSLLAQVDSMRAIGNLLAVEEYLEKAHKYDETNEAVTIQLLRYYDKTGQSTKTQNTVNELKRHEIPVPDYIGTDEVSNAVDTLPESKADLETLLAASPNNWQAWRALGHHHLNAGSWQDAHDAFKKATVIRPDDPNSQFGFGRALQELGDHSHAIHAFEESLNRDKQQPETKKALTRSLMAYVEHMREIGNLLAVEQYLERAHKNDISDESVTAQLLGYYIETGQSGKRQFIEQELTRHGLHIPEAVQLEAANVEHKSTQAEEERTFDSIEEVRAHLDANGEDWKSWRRLGFMLVDAGDASGAQAAFKKATVIRNDDADSQYGLGLSHQLQGDHSHAIHPFEEALRQDGKHEKAKAALKTSLLAYCDHMTEIGNLLAVEQFLEKAYKCDLEDKAVGQRLLDYYKETGQGNKAAKLGQELGVYVEAPAATTAASNTSDDLLLPTERQYQPEVPRDQPAATSAQVLLDPLAPAQPAGGPPQTVQQPQQLAQMLPCPKCKQMMPSRSRLCPHCGSVVDLITGQVLSGKADRMGLSTEEKVYKVCAVLRILYGLLLVALGMVVPVLGIIFTIVGAWALISGLGLLFEVEWIQMIVYWASFLSLLRGLSSGFFAVLAGNWIAVILDFLFIALDGLTMWSISKISDSGG
jgi:tetratricopeptide (TPR) repeat protein